MTDLRSIRIETARAALELFTDADGHLYQASFGQKSPAADPADPARRSPAFPTAGNGWTFDPALRVTHADGNTSTDLRVRSVVEEAGGVRIGLADPEYPFYVDLCFRTYPEIDVFETWTEIHHAEPGEVVLHAYASSAPDFGPRPFWLTQFHGDWANEVNMYEERLGPGIKVLDSKLGVRAHQFRAPWFLLSADGPAQEDTGEVFGGSLAWSGSFEFAFEVLPSGHLRARCGVNPYASAYTLVPGERFSTPTMAWGWSDSGTGTLSRHLHRYVRDHIVRDGSRLRAVLLNNWEATYFRFDEAKIISLFDGARDLGMELFLLDDGWFGVKYPRDDDTQGLGDWIPDPKKLPNGIGALVEAAQQRGLRFGIWLEPEMVNPKSDLFERHPDWAIQQPHREWEEQRNQMILDLTRPDVQAYVYEVCDRVLAENPGISYVKWDCNRYITQPGSPYLAPGRQSHLWVDYVRALYDVMDRLAKAHPHVEIMMCSGGGGRVDYGALRYAQEFWPSDMTDPARRVFIQWGYSHFFPAITMSAHVTDFGKRPLKFAFDVAMSGRLGMDMDVDQLSPEERAFAQAATAKYKTFRDVVQLGEQFRLESPYAGPRSALMYRHGERAVLFVYSLGDAPAGPLRLKGLSATATYRLREVNRWDGESGPETLATGAELMDGGLELPAFGPHESAVYEIGPA